MGIRLIYGKPGSGKSEFCFKEIAENLGKGNKIYIITPEQFSFTAEQKLMQITKSNAVMEAEVVHLSRMAYRVLTEVGGATKTHLSKCGKAMLIYRILEQERSNLKFLGKSEENIELVMRAITELKKHKVSVLDLKQEMQSIEDVYLQNKLKDLCLLYEKFEEKIKGEYIEETDLLDMLAKGIGKTNIVKNSIIYLDEFAGFTKQEYEVIAQFVRLAKQVNITICADDLNINTNPDKDIFYSNKKTLSKIWNMANENEFTFEKPVHLENQHRFKTEELQTLSENINNIKSTKYGKNVDNIHLFLAQNPYSEIENIAKTISNIVKQKDIRYKDIAIITKNIGEYSSLVRAIFSKYNIPVFIDEKREVSQSIIIQYVLAILEVICKNFSKEAVFNYLKLGFLNIEQDEIFTLENYCNKWGIKQNKWKRQFTYEVDKNPEKVERFNQLRKLIIEPLLDFKEKINKDKTAKNITKYLYQFLQKQNIEEQLTKKVRELEKNGLIDLANEYISSYQVIIKVLDEIVLLMGNDKITLDAYYKILKIGFKNSELATIPGTQDQVTFGDVDRSRSHKVKTVFIIGLNDGSFPSPNKDEGFLDDRDRERLEKDGIELAKGTLERLYEDKFNVYKAFTTAENNIYLSYTSSDKEGKALRPSTLIQKIKKIYPKLEEKSDMVQKEYAIINEETTYESFLENLAKLAEGEKIENIWYVVYKYCMQKGELQEKLKNDLQALNYTNLPQQIKQENIDKLYGSILKTSVSRLERYRSCPFSYYLQYGLKLKEKEELKIRTFDTGSFMHQVIDEFFEEVNEQKLKLVEIEDEQIKKIVSKIVEQNLQLSKNAVFTSTAKYRVLVKRLKKIVSKALKYIIQTLIYSDFNIEGTEIEFGKNGKYKPIYLELESRKKN